MFLKTFNIITFHFNYCNSMLFDGIRLQAVSLFIGYKNKKLSYRRDSAHRRPSRRSKSFKVTDFATN